MYETGWKDHAVYEQFSFGGTYFEELERLQQDRVWDAHVGDIAITILSDALKVSIVVIRTGNRPYYFPDDKLYVDDDTIVIVQDESQTHYDASKKGTADRKWLRV